MLASAPLLPKFVREGAAMDHELRKRGISAGGPSMNDVAPRTLPPTRPERVIALDAMGAVGDVARPLTPIERIANITAVRRLAVLVVLAAAWEAYARYTANPLLFPSLTETLAAFW